MLEWTHQEPNGRRDASGGVFNLLKALRIDGHAAVACLALRQQDGRFSLATFPQDATALPGLERLDEALDEVWTDPALGSGDVMLRAVRHLSEPATAEPLRLAVASLRWPETHDPAWGLVCLLGPLEGSFDQEQCERLARYATRIVAYFDARRTLLDKESGTVGGAVRTLRPLKTTSPPDLRDEDADERLDGDHGDHGDHGDELEVEIFVPKLKKKNKHKKNTKHRRPDTGLTSNKQILGAVAEAPAEDDNGASGAKPPVSIEQPETARPSHASDGASGSVARLLTELDGDPVTGLAGLPALVAELGVTMGYPDESQRHVGLVLLRIEVDAMPPEDKTAVEVAATLRLHRSGQDVSFRLSEDVFAVMRPGAADGMSVDRTRDQLDQALRLACRSTSSTCSVRSIALSTNEQSGSMTPELLMRTALSELAR